MQGYIPLTINEENKVAASIAVLTKEKSDNNLSGRSAGFSQEKIEYQEKRFRWVAQNVPAFKPEPYITSSRDYISRMNFELSSTQFPNSPLKKYMGSWEDINKQYADSESFGGEVTGNGFLKKTVEEVTNGIAEPEQKISAIVNYVKQNIAWDGYSRKVTSKPMRKVLDEKKGNSAEINLLLASMLEKASINVYPVLLSTRDHGFIREATPISSQFNYVVCLAAIGDKTFLLDATEKLLPVGMLPERCLNGNGLIVSKGGFRWTPLQTKTKSRIVVNADLTLTPEANLVGKLQIDRSGYDALAGRKKYFSKDEADYVKDFIGTRSWEISKSEIGNAKEIHQPMKEVYDLTVSEHITAAGNVFYLNPLLLYRIDENPLKLETREYPVDFSSPFERIVICRITLPEGFDVDELPQPKAISLPANAGRYTYSVTQAGRVLNILSNFQINQSIFVPQEYAHLREFYNQVVAKQAEQIVLKKK